MLVNGDLKGASGRRRVTVALAVAESSAHDILKTGTVKSTEHAARNDLTSSGAAERLLEVGGVEVSLTLEHLASPEQA